MVSAGAALVALCGAEDSGAAAEVSSFGRLSGFWQEARRQAEATRARPAQAERRIVEVCIFPRFCVWEAKADGGNRRPHIRPSKAERRGARCHYGLANTETRGERLVDVLVRRRHHQRLWRVLRTQLSQEGCVLGQALVFLGVRVEGPGHLRLAIVIEGDIGHGGVNGGL